MNLKYEIVFTVEVLNDYFANLQCPALDIIPTNETLAILKARQMMGKTIGNKYIVLGKINDDGTPFIPLETTAQLRFLIGINDADFMNYSNINYRPSTAGKYYFSNLNQTKLGTDLYLNQKIAKYDNNLPWAIGSLASDNPGNIYEATKASDKTNKHALTETAYWLPKGKNQYVNNGDVIPFTGSTYIATASTAATDFSVNIYGLNKANNKYETLLRTSAATYPLAQKTTPVDFSNLPFGKYKITVNTDTLWVYYDDVAAKQNILGIIEIFNHLPATNDFGLFNAGGVSKQNNFILRFANRSAVWKYIARTADITAITDSDTVYTFTTVAKSNVFTSTVPIPLKQQPINTITIDSATLGAVAPIGNPGVNRLGNITQNNETYYCIEKHLNF